MTVKITPKKPTFNQIINIINFRQFKIFYSILKMCTKVKKIV